MKYTPLEKLNLFLVAYGKLFAAIFRPRVWLSFFVLALFQAVALYLLVKIYIPGWQSIINPILRVFISPEALHYPRYYLILPTLFTAVDSFILGPTVWVVLSAAAVFSLSRYFDGEASTFSRSLKSAVGQYWRLLVFWAVETLIVVAILLLPSLLMKSFVWGSPNRKLALDAGLQLLTFAVSAYLLYVIPAIIIGRQKLGGALYTSISLCWKNYFLTFFIIFLPGLIRMAVSLVLSEFSFQIVRFLNPDLIIVLLGLSIGLGIFVNLFIYGAAVYVYKDLT
jgi:hypothetical protein